MYKENIHFKKFRSGKTYAFLALLIIAFSQSPVYSQFSKENSGEFIFAFSNVDFMGAKVPTKMRFTCFFHAGQNLHYDFTNKLGVFTGYGIRNIGIVTDENNIVVKRRTYSMGIPLAFKLGSFNKHFYMYGGGEYELFFHYKQKQYINDSKKKESEWFSNRTKRFAPSVFAGLQLPGGINLKFKFYPENFLNQDYQGKDFNQSIDYSDFTKSQLFYFSIGFNFKNKDLKKLYNPGEQPGRIASL